MSWLSPYRWLLIGAAIAALMLGIWRLDVSRQQIGYDKAQTEYTASALAASEAARKKEQELQTKVERVSNDYQTEKKRRAADARVSADRLRDLQVALDGASASDSAAACGDHDDPRSAIIAQCAGTASILDGAVKQLAGQNAALQNYIRGVCLAP